MSKPNTWYFYRPKVKPVKEGRAVTTSPKSKGKDSGASSSQTTNLVTLKNAFDSLKESDNVFENINARGPFEGNGIY